MPIRVCSTAELTPHPKGRKSDLDRMPELNELKATLAHGLKPYEAVEVELPNSSLKNLRLLFRHRVTTYLKRLKLSNYKVSMYKANGKEYIAVSHGAFA